MNEHAKPMSWRDCAAVAMVYTVAALVAGIIDGSTFDQLFDRLYWGVLGMVAITIYVRWPK